MAAVCFVAAGVAAYFGITEGRQSKSLSAVEPVACGEVSPGPVEVSGAAGATESLVAPEAGIPVAYFDYRVTHHWEEHDRHQNDGDRSESRVIHDESSHAAIQVSDNSGSVFVDLDGADLDHLEEIIDERRPYREDSAPGLIGHVFDAFDGRHNEYLHVRVRVIRPGTQLFVHGQAFDRGGQLVIGDGGDHFVVSTRNEESLSKATSRNAALAWLAAGGLAGSGVIAVVVGLVG